MRDEPPFVDAALKPYKGQAYESQLESNNGPAQQTERKVMNLYTEV